MLSTKLKEAAGNSADATLYVNDVFSTYLYTGNGSTQTITNGIDLAGKGGMVWIKSRSAATDHKLTDTVRGATKAIISNSTASETTDTTGLTAFSSTGFSLGANLDYNNNTTTYASWTFRKAAKFFDVVTYTGNGTSQNIAHSLGSVPGCIIIRDLSFNDNWFVYHKDYNGGTNAYQYRTFLNFTNAVNGPSSIFLDAAPTSTNFSVGSSTSTNGSGIRYVAYLYAHDTSSTGIIQCGSYTGNGSATGPVVTLGWEPQYLMVKNASGTGNWIITDSMRGFTTTGSTVDPDLSANTADAENAYLASNWVSPTATGFNLVSAYAPVNTSGATYIYMAIRMPNKPPTTGTQVYYSSLGTGGTPGVVSGFSPDLAIGDFLTNGGTYAYFPIWTDRLRGNNNSLVSSSTVVESSPLSSCIFYQTGFGTSAWNSVVNAWLFKRAPGFFDEVCYTGTGVATTQAHNLTVAPELMIVKSRSNPTDWMVYASPVGATQRSILNLTQAFVTDSFPWNNTSPTASVFTVGTSGDTNSNGLTYVAYLFATLAGISKVGSYTGNGSTGQAIACGFSAGARFVLIKRTDSTGDWYTFDSARGLTSSSSPYLLLNSTAAEVTGNNGVYASTGGFTLATSAAGLNASGGTYIFLAVA